MERDVKVALGIGVLLVSIVAVVFFRSDDRAKFAKILPRATRTNAPENQRSYPGRIRSARSRANSVANRLPQAESAAEQIGPRPNQSGAGRAPQRDSRGSLTHKSQPPTTRQRRLPALAQPQLATPRFYEVKSGDTLIGIARKVLGNGDRYRELFKANEHQLSSSNHLPVGIRLILPE